MFINRNSTLYYDGLNVFAEELEDFLDNHEHIAHDEVGTSFKIEAFEIGYRCG